MLVMLTYAMCMVEWQHMENPILGAPFPGMDQAPGLALQVMVAQHHALHTRDIYRTPETSIGHQRHL